MSDTQVETPNTDETMSDAEWENSAGVPVVEAETPEQAEAEQAPVESDATATVEADAPEGEDAPESDEKDPGRSRGQLETDVVSVLKAVEAGEVEADREKLTPHRVSRLVQSVDSLVKPPSTGAVSDVFTRLAEIGFIEIDQKPFRFVGFTDAARNEGLTALKARRAEARKTARAAAKAAAKAPVEAEATEGD